VISKISDVTIDLPQEGESEVSAWESRETLNPVKVRHYASAPSRMLLGDAVGTIFVSLRQRL